MTIFKCPGSAPIKNPQPDEIICPTCGEETEIWSDEEEAVCPSCGRTVYRELGPSCLKWCASARECLGPAKYDRLKGRRNQ
ncbi:MAG TPA: hypothetical protein PLZ73_04950 [bacterium]|nr:hypothetical protein [bacterium]